MIVGVADVDTALARMRSRLSDLEPLMDSLGGMVIEHVHDRYRNQGRSRKYDGRGGQPKWKPITKATRDIRKWRTGHEDGIIWFESGESIRGITTLSRSNNHIEIGWNAGDFAGRGGSRIPYPYLLDSFTVHTKGMIPGKVVEPRHLLYFTRGFVEHAVKEVVRWIVSPLGIEVG